jgi:uncharacterized Zn-binding protein involved in type VI secretion
MLRRYYIRLGAKTTAGGVVKAAGTKDLLNGVAMAIEGDPIDCPACGTEGVIEAVPPRGSDTYNGKQFALSDDLCICRCSPSPKLLADQGAMYQILALASVESAEEKAARAVSSKTAEMIPLRLADEATGKPYVHCSYQLELHEKTIEGVTDGDGLTRPLTLDERAALVAWHVSPTPA